MPVDDITFDYNKPSGLIEAQPEIGATGNPVKEEIPLSYDKDPKEVERKGWSKKYTEVEPILNYIGRKFNAEGWGIIKKGDYGHQVLQGKMTYEEAFEMSNALDAKNKAEYGDRLEVMWSDNAFKRGIGEVVQAIPYMGVIGVKGATGAAIGAGAGALTALGIGQAGPQALVPEELVTVPALTSIGARVGAAGTSGYEIFKIERGNTYMELRERGVSHDRSKDASFGVGVVSSSLEIIGLKALTAPVLKYVKKEALDTLSKNIITHVGKEYAKRTGIEWTTEMGQELTQMGYIALATWREAQETPGVKKMTWEEFHSGMMDAAASILVVSGTFAGGGIGFDAASFKRQMREKAGLDVPQEKQTQQTEQPAQMFDPDVKETQRIEQEIEQQNIELDEELAAPDITPEEVKEIEKTKQANIEKTKQVKEVNKEIEAELDNRVKISKELDTNEGKLTQLEDTKAGLESEISSMQKQLEGTDIAEDVEKIKGEIKLNKEKLKNVNSQIKEVEKQNTRLENQYMKSDERTNTLKSKLRETIRETREKIKNDKIQQDYKRNVRQISKELKPKVATKDGKAKFDLETTGVLMNLREINKITNAEAQTKLAETADTPASSFEELLTRKMLAFKSGAKNTASPAFVKSLLSDIQRIKKEGRDARNEAELARILNKKAEVDEAIQAFQKYDKAHPVVQKIVDFYTKNIANIYSLFNAMGGKAFADKYDINTEQVYYANAIHKVTKEMTEKAVKILGLKDKYALQGVLADMSERNPEWVMNKLEDNKVSRKLSTFDLIDIYNNIQNEDIAQDYYDTYGQENVLRLVSNLTPEQIKLADEMVELVRGYYDVANEYNIEKKGLPLPQRAKYWPATSEATQQEYDILNQYIPNSTIPSFLKNKVNKVTPVPMNAWVKMQGHINQAEYITHMAGKYSQLDNIFRNQDVRYLITDKFGAKTLQQIDNELSFLGLKGRREFEAQYAGVFNKLLSGWTIAKTASVPVFVKQLLSFTNYATDMPVSTWAKYTMEGLSNPKKTMDYMLKELPYLQARFDRGYDDAISIAIREAEKASAVGQKITKAATFMTKSGDIGAIVYGGYAYYKNLLDSGMTKEQAERAFITRTEKAQQGSQSSNLSALQKGKHFNFFSRFLNTPNQYLRLIVDAQMQYSRGEITAAEYHKVMGMYVFIQPVLYSSVGVAFSQLGAALIDDDDEAFKASDYLLGAFIQIVITPFNALPIINSIMAHFLRDITGREAYDVFSLQMFTEMAYSLEGIKSSIDNENVAGILYNSAVLSEPVTRVPFKNIAKTIDMTTGGAIKEARSNKKKSKSGPPGTGRVKIPGT